MRTFFLTGGEGFIGYHICQELAFLDDVKIVTYDAQKHCLPLEKCDWAFWHRYRIDRLDNLGVTRIRGDTTDKGLLKESLLEHKPDVIIHLASIPSADVSNKYPQEAKLDILDGTITVLQIIQETGLEIEKFIYTSSSMVYGNFPVDMYDKAKEVTEDDRCEPIGIYGAMKLSGEYITKAYGHRFGIPWAIIRPSAVYGPTGCNRFVAEIFLMGALRGQKLYLDNGGEELIDFTYVKDTAHGFLLVATKPIMSGQIFNITRGQAQSVKELADIVQRLVPGTEFEPRIKKSFRPSRGTLQTYKAGITIGYSPRYDLERGMTAYLNFIKEVGFETNSNGSK